jgi:hypothetical protein
MKQFTAKIQWKWEDEVLHECKKETGCRELLILSMSHILGAGEKPHDFVLSLKTEDLPQQLLEEIAQPAKLTISVQQAEDTLWGRSTNWFVCAGNDDTILEAFYWLILGDRFREYYNEDFLKMILRSNPYDWDYAVERTRSIKLWKEYKKGKIVSTHDMLFHCRGPIDIRKAVDWK